MDGLGDIPGDQGSDLVGVALELMEAADLNVLARCATPHGTELDLGAVKYKAEYARFSRREVLGDIVVELVCILDLGLRSVDQAEGLITPCRDSLGLVFLLHRDLAEGNSQEEMVVT